MLGAFFEKLLDYTLDFGLKFLIHVVKVISPIKINPKKIEESNNSEWKKITDFKIENRLNSIVYNILVTGISKEAFDIKVITDDGPKGKTVEHSEINTNRMILYAKDKRNGNYLWIFRIQKLAPRECINLKIKVVNKHPVYFKTVHHRSKEVPIRENNKGVIEVPIVFDDIPTI